MVNSKVPTRVIPWPLHKAARVSINNFGFGGSNAHAILERHTAIQGSNDSLCHQADCSRLYVFSAKCKTALQANIEALKSYVANANHSCESDFHPPRLPDGLQIHPRSCGCDPRATGRKAWFDFASFRTFGRATDLCVHWSRSAVCANGIVLDEERRLQRNHTRRRQISAIFGRSLVSCWCVDCALPLPTQLTLSKRKSPNLKNTLESMRRHSASLRRPRCKSHSSFFWRSTTSVRLESVAIRVERLRRRSLLGMLTFTHALPSHTTGVWLPLSSPRSIRSVPTVL
jgi:hypothetical protein